MKLPKPNLPKRKQDLTNDGATMNNMTDEKHAQKDVRADEKNTKAESLLLDETELLDESGNEQEEPEQNAGLLAGLLDIASKAGIERLGRKKFDPSSIESDVTKNMAQMEMPESQQNKLRLAFLGGGSFGTAMANLAARNGSDSTLWVRNKRTVKAMQKNRVNKKYLPNHPLDARLKYSHDLEATVKDKDIIFVAVPSSAFRETLQNIAPFISGQAVVSLTKGMEKDTFAMMSDIITDELPEVNFGVMSGP